MKAMGTKLKRESVADSGTYNTIGKFTNFTLPFTLETTDNTGLDNDETDESYRTNEPTLKQVGDITGELYFNPNNAEQNEATGLLKDLDDMFQRRHRVVLPGGWYAQVVCSIVNAVIQGQVDGLVMMNVTLRPSGKPTFGTE